MKRPKARGAFWPHSTAMSMSLMLTIVKAIIMVLGATGVTGMWAAVFADVGVCLVAILNASRAMKMK